jgi:hypothetical protein
MKLGKTALGAESPAKPAVINFELDMIQSGETPS